MRIQLWCRAVCQSAPRILVLCEGRLFFLLVCAVAGMGYAEEIVSIFRKGRPCCCSYRCGSIALAVHHPSVGCMDCGQQHDAADYPQARTRYDTFLSPVKGCSSSPHLHSSLFLRTERGGDVPGGVGHADLLPRHSIDLRVLAEMKRKEAEQLQQRQS